MKIKLTIGQLKKILKTQSPKYPITIMMTGIDKAELAELVTLLKSKRKS